MFKTFYWLYCDPQIKPFIYSNRLTPPKNSETDKQIGQMQGGKGHTKR